MLGVEIDLANIGDLAHQRAGRTAAAPAATPAGGERDVLTGALRHHHRAGPLGREQVDDGALAGENAPRRKHHGRSEARPRAR